MNRANETEARALLQDDVITLGAISVETKGPGFETEVMSLGDIAFFGISEE